MKQIPTSLWTLLAGVAIALVSLWVGQHHGLLPEQASEQAVLVDRFFNVMVTIGTALFLIVQGAIVWFLIQFRRRSGDDTDGLPIEGNFSLEIVWTVIPAVIVIGLGIYSVDIYERMGGFAPAHGMMHAMTTPSAAESTPHSTTYGIGAAIAGETADVQVNVMGLQYAWLFSYPESGVTAGELHVPVGKSVQLNISAQDVIHSLWIPQFRLKQDALPGQPSQLRFVATKLGTYPVVCAELCGGYHGSMRTQLIVQSPDDYATWLRENQVAQAPTNDAPAQVALAKPSQDQDVAEFLEPYVQDLGIQPDRLTQLYPDTL